MDADSAMSAGKKARMERCRSVEAIVRHSSALIRRADEADPPTRSCNLTQNRSYLRVLPISVNTVLTLVPTVWTAVIMKTAISDAISAYSIAVAPESLTAKFLMDLNIGCSCCETLSSGQLSHPCRLTQSESIHPRFQLG